MKKTVITLLLLFTSFLEIKAQHTSEASGKAYEYLQGERAKADKVLGDWAKPPLDSLKKAEKILQDALTYYHSQDVKALAKTDKYLFGRESDINFDMAVIKIKKGEQNGAIALLKKNLSGSSGSAYAKWMKNDTIFESVVNAPELLPFFKKIEASNRVFNGTALNTPYKYNISDAEKLAGLSKFWSEAKYNFAYFENLPDLDWDKLYLEYIPLIQNTKNTLEYYQVMQKFCAELKDSHTNVWSTSDSLRSLTNFAPPIRTTLVEGKVLITSVLSDSLQKSGIKVGMEVVSIDKIPVKEYAQKLMPYQSSSTEQDLRLRTFTYSLLRGNREQTVELELKGIDGKISTRKLPRKGYGVLKKTESVEFKILPNNVAYLAINEFETSKSREKFMSIFDSLSNTTALILDIRRNGGGSTDVSILKCLTDKPIKQGQHFVRKYVPTYRAWGSEEGIVWQQEPVSDWSPNGKKLYTKPVVLLISSQTFSAAEDFAVIFDSMKRGKMIGEVTGGSTGQPLPFSLPGGLMGRVCTKRDLYPDGKVFVGVGIKPDIEIKPTIVDIQKGRDTVLEGALEYLKQQK
ncbi:S41 family peptidase [Lacihabitans sp. CCS-44]|uniref:S41 family peptidase n=1 Tax=Lacihabitans sp. CCS-44 TaxID=2487331 RepID=UPI0020CCAB61|nr:S41 family peptidase [Lacihabitans sp. CCS-44]